MIECVFLAGAFWLKAIDIKDYDAFVRVDQIEAINGHTVESTIFLSDPNAKTVLPINIDDVVKAIADCEE